ncbi:MAG: DUF2341 domain-containing protein [Spirochaetales bacterium]|nr:DUF2341 domain-containing protein [Spirochaetales bacterium]
MKKHLFLIPGVLIMTFLITQCLTFGGIKKTIRIDPVTPVDEYQVMIRISPDHFNYKAAQPDGSDIRVLDTEGQLLNFWIENWNPYGISYVWVRIPHAGTDRVVITSNNRDETQGSDGTKVFDPVSWEIFKSDWQYSGIVPGMVSGWENQLTEFDFDVSGWKPVAIDSDFVEECEHSRWFVRKEFFIARGEIIYSGEADDDYVWTLIGSDELYMKIGGAESDSDGKNPGAYSGSINFEQPFGHFIWAGRGQEGAGQEKLTISNLDSGIEGLYTRKILNDARLLDKEEVREGENEDTKEIDDEIAGGGTEDSL